MKTKIINALLSVCIVVALGSLSWIVTMKIQDYQANRAQAAAQQANRLERERQRTTTTTSTTTTTTVSPATTTLPRATTTVATTTTTSTTTTTTVPLPVPPARETIPVNSPPFGDLLVPAIGFDQTIARADEADDGHEALKGGTAWFASSSRTVVDLLPTNNLALPGEGGSVAIGGHRGGNGRAGVFGRLHELNKGDEIVVDTDWGRFTYRVTIPCPDGDQAGCSLIDEKILGHFAEYESSVETLFLFSCDSGMRIYVVAELVNAKV